MLSVRQIVPIIILGIIFFAGPALADEGGSDNSELHCTLGSISIAVLIGTLLTGPLLKGRFGRIKGLKPYPLHMCAMVILSIYLTGVFIFRGVGRRGRQSHRKRP